MLHPDGGKRFEMGFTSVESLRIFIGEMSPREVHIVPSAGSDILEAQLSRKIDDSVH